MYDNNDEPTTIALSAYNSVMFFRQSLIKALSKDYELTRKYYYNIHRNIIGTYIDTDYGLFVITKSASAAFPLYIIYV